MYTSYDRNNFLNWCSHSQSYWSSYLLLWIRIDIYVWLKSFTSHCKHFPVIEFNIMINKCHSFITELIIRYCIDQPSHSYHDKFEISEGWLYLLILAWRISTLCHAHFLLRCTSAEVTLMGGQQHNQHHRHQCRADNLSCSS